MVGKLLNTSFPPTLRSIKTTAALRQHLYDIPRRLASERVAHLLALAPRTHDTFTAHHGEVLGYNGVSNVQKHGQDADGLFALRQATRDF
jgi:hypothetical protein